ncbi:adhesion G protein-coupled receptor L3-like [Oppia nitens]|uniref:adhesion G protein-coupled receptor L3-like n=1 Tax=Oppia nitens TaxID=1686743 RepID=UPI0023DA4E74|nr:adhesion G protein-coupled receptor L3-like [Oppia nitens]
MDQSIDDDITLTVSDTEATLDVTTNETINTDSPAKSQKSTVSTQKSLAFTSSTTVSLECNSDGKYDGQHGIKHWPPVSPGTDSRVDCPGRVGIGDAGSGVSWKCQLNGQFSDEGPDWTECGHWLDELDNKTESIHDIAEAIEMIETISNRTGKSDTIIDSQRLSQALDIVSKVQTFVDTTATTSSGTDTDSNLCAIECYTSKMLDTLANILDQTYAWTNSTTDKRTSMAEQILTTSQSTAYSLALRQNLTTNLLVVDNSDFYINTFYVNTAAAAVELTFPYNNPNQTSIVIPSDTEFANNTVRRTNQVVGAIIHNIGDYLSDNLEDNYEINSYILSFSMTNDSQSVLLNRDVIISLEHKKRLQFGDKVQCVYWDFAANQWSDRGCITDTQLSDRYHTVCRCNHLTNFAALMDVSGRERRTVLKSALTYSCSIVSIVSLIVAINLIVRSRHCFINSQQSRDNSLNEMRAIITTNLCVCLLITNFLVVLGMDRTDVVWLCRLSSGSLLYSLMSSFFWMLLEGFYLYKSLVSCFNWQFKARYLYAVGYGLPVAIIFVAFLVIYCKHNIVLEALFDHRYSYFCWISSTHYSSHIWILIG